MSRRNPTRGGSSNRRRRERTSFRPVSRRWPSNLANLLRSAGGGSWPGHPLAVLLGLAAGWQWSGMRTILSWAIDPLPTTAAMLGAIVLLAAALGPWLPERVVLGVARLIRRRRQRRAGPSGDGSGTLWMLPPVHERDESLMWLSLSVLASVAGAASLATLALSGLFTRVYHYLLDQFFWTDVTLAGLEWCGVGLLVGVSWVIHGVILAALSPVAALATGPQRRPAGVAAGVLFGLGLAWVAHERWADRGLSGSQEFMAGVVPMFVLAGVSARRSQRADQLPRAAAQDETAPELTAGAEGLLWLSLVVLGIAAVLVGSGWLACRSMVRSGWSPGDTSLGWYLLVVGGGVAAASLHSRRGPRSASGCGMAAWAAGVGAGAAATLTSYRPAGAAATTAQLALLAVPIGYALHYAERAWLARVGSETLGFAQLTSAVLAGLGIGLIGARWWALPTLGAMGVITAGALLLLASGGLMQIYEQERPVRIRHMRLGLVFASLAGAIVLFPADAKRWVRWEREYRPLERAAVDFEELALGDLSQVRSICLIGVDPTGVGRNPALSRASVRVMPLSLGGLAEMVASPAAGRTRAYCGSAFRELGLGRGRYDLIYQRATASCPVGRFAEYSAEWLGRLAEHTLPGGRLIIDVPLEGMTTSAVVVVAATFEHAVGVPAAWKLVDAGGRPLLRLMASPGVASPIRNDGPGPWSAVRQLLGDRADLRPHSLRRDALTPALQTGDPEAVASLVEWLERCRTTAPAADGA